VKLTETGSDNFWVMNLYTSEEDPKSIGEFEIYYVCDRLWVRV